MKGLFKLKLAATLTLALLFGIVAGILALLLWFSGASGLPGVALVLIFSIFLIFIQWYFSPSIIKSVYRMRELGEEEYPWIHEIVEEICKEERMKKPKIYLVNDPTPNAFAFGRGKNSANVAIHQGLLDLLDKEEVKAVIAHELGHIRNRDMIVMCVASVLPILLYYLAIIFSPRRRDEEGSLGILIFFLAMLAQFVGRLIVLWLSRIREYYADSFSAYVTRSPRSLASALAKISYELPNYRKSRAHSMLRAFYIADPFSSEGVRRGMEAEKKLGALEWFMTHPLTYKRIENLRRIEEELKGEKTP